MAEDMTAKRVRGPKGKRAGGEGKRPGGQDKATTTMLDVLYMVSRVAGSFDAVLKTKEPVLSLSQWAILQTLAGEEEAARPSQLARKLAFSRQLIQQAAKKLIKLELIAAETSEDKKAVSLRLTDAGRAQLQTVSATIEGFGIAMKQGKSGARTDGLAKTARTLKGVVAALSTDSKGNRRKKKPAEDEAEVAAAADA